MKVSKVYTICAYMLGEFLGVFFVLSSLNSEYLQRSTTSIIISGVIATALYIATATRNVLHW
jgi:hypothetical protein